MLYYLFIIFVVVVAFIFERTVGMWLSVFYVPIPFVVAVTLFMSWRFGTVQRLWFGGVVGFLLDSISPLPFGVYISVFFFLAALTHFLQFFFSNIASSFTRSVSMGILLLSFFIAAPLVSMGINWAVGEYGAGILFWFDWNRIGIAAVLWSFIFFAVSFFTLERFRERFS